MEELTPSRHDRHCVWTTASRRYGAVRPAILIIEPRPEIAAALAQVVASAHYQPIVRPYVTALTDVGVTPAAIVVRVSSDGLTEPSHRALEGIRVRPPVVAIVWEDDEVAEAERLGCEVILRAPGDIARLCEALSRLVHA